jgi:ketosteroid isomerase-like protein
MTTVERLFRSAKADRRWEEASRLRREQAMALFRLAGSPSTPPEALVELKRDAEVAELRGIARIAREARLVSADCCDICRADDGRIFRIALELRAPRLPHQGCPTGLCRCRWALPPRD